VVFAILLVSANTMAMSVRERVREVAVLKTLGFTRQSILAFFVGEAVTIAFVGGLLGVLAATGLVTAVSKSPSLGFFGNFHTTSASILIALAIAALVGFGSAFLPSYHASRMNIVEGLRHVG
jgi:putative ABC transport system permease protein